MASASSSARWRRCQRESAYTRLYGDGFSGARDSGTASHLRLELWLKYRIAVPKTDKALYKALEHIPRPDQALSEQRFTMHYRGVEHRGILDFLYGYVPRLCIVVGDYKTTSDAKQWADKERDNDQRVSYAYWAMMTFNVQTVRTEWVYANRNGKHVEPVVITYSKAELEERMLHYHTHVAKPYEVNKDENPAFLPRNMDSCWMFREGCTHRRRCHVDVPTGQIVDSALRHLARKQKKK